MRSGRLLRNDASSSGNDGRDGRGRETNAGNAGNAGSAESGAVGAAKPARFRGTRLVALCAVVLLGLSLSLAGCSGPWSATAAPSVDPAQIVSQAIFQLQAVFGLPDGAVTRSSQPPVLSGSDVALRWLGGRADVDLRSGRIRAILADGTSRGFGAPLADAKLDDRADRVVALLGWDAAALETQGFTPGDTKTVDHGEAGTIFQKSWVGHDAEGVLNEGVIEVGLDTVSGELHSFLYSPGPEVALDVTKAISRDAAIREAKQAVVKALAGTTGDSSSVSQSTTTTAPAGGSTTTTLDPLRVSSATLVHTDAPGITSGKDMLVWVVKVGGENSGRGARTVYLEATTGDLLVVMAS